MTTGKVPPPPKGPVDPKWADDDRAKKEEKQWVRLDRAKEWADTVWARCWGVVAIIILFVFAGLFLGSLISWAAHYLLPVSWHWLNEAQLSKIQSVIFSGSLGGVISFVAQKQLSK